MNAYVRKKSRIWLVLKGIRYILKYGIYNTLKNNTEVFAATQRWLHPQSK
jgi:hypothetical protein